MNRLEEIACSCPYCGEAISLLLDGSEAEQDYIEDCQVCCRPILVNVTVEGDEINCYLQAEND